MGTRVTDKDVSLHHRILAEIEGNILSGAWPPGYRIPFETALARDYGCSRMTVNKVLTKLAESGLIERRRRSGSTVRRPTAQSAVLEIRDIAEEVASLGQPYRYRLLSRQVRKADAGDRAALDLSKGATVLHVACLHMAGDEPFCFEDRVINLAAAPEAENQPFDEIGPGSWLVGLVPWSAAEHVVSAEGAEGAVAEALGVPAGFPCLVMERRTRFDGAFVTAVRLFYRGDRHRLTATFAPAQAGGPAAG